MGTWGLDVLGREASEGRTMATYPYIVEKDRGTYLIRFPGVPEALTSALVSGNPQQVRIVTSQII